MGKGVAIMPEAGQVFAPVNGTVTVVYPTGHAYAKSTRSSR